MGVSTLFTDNECFEVFVSPVTGKKAPKTSEFLYFSSQPQKTTEPDCFFIFSGELGEEFSSGEDDRQIRLALLQLHATLVEQFVHKLFAFFFGQAVPIQTTLRAERALADFHYTLLFCQGSTDG